MGRDLKSLPYLPMKILVICLLFLALSFPAFPDEIKVPFSCWPQELQSAFIEKNLKLDLDPNERTESSFGYVMNRGAEYTIFSYKAIDPDTLVLIQKIVFKVELDHGKNNSNGNNS